jgi:predicted metal-binding protein
MVEPIVSRPTPWKTVILTCGKCARKMDGGYGPKGKDTLRTALNAALRDAGRRREIHVIETRCMGICPKKATTMLNTSKPDAIMTVHKGTAMGAVLGLLR